ncbi:MAG: TonB-dependent receptor [Nitrospira sp.]|nr:TonB-dependent receptor [Nitrospira sp.]
MRARYKGRVGLLMFLIQFSSLGSGAGHTADQVAAATEAETHGPQAKTPDDEQDFPIMLDEVEVRDRRAAMDIDPIRSRTTVTSKELGRRQSDNVFTVLQDVPSVSINGGPLMSGMKFNIRGFSNTEDVLIKLDGAMRNFEKYRFGSGVFVEPELLKEIAVTRGPAGVLQGSGAIGGAVEMQTKDAADLLRPGERFGARIKSGFSSNNMEKLVSGSAYGKVFGSFDLLANAAWRDSDNIRTASGKELPNTTANRLSVLAKATYGPQPGMRLSLAETYLQEETLQPFDATIGIPGVFGFVRRAVQDSTSTMNWEYTPNGTSLARWINLKGTVGYTMTSVTDSDKQDATGIPIPDSPTNFWDYHIATLNLTNTTEAQIGPLLNTITYGVQYNRNSRAATTVQLNPVTRTWETVENLGQPSGTRSFLALMAEYRLDIGQVSLTAGLRHDFYRVEVNARQTRELLQAEGRSPVIEFGRTVPTAGIAWNVLRGPFTLFYHYAEAFRPPLVDEYFTQGPFSRCNRAFFGNLAPPSGVCGDRYRPQVLRNHEIGMSLSYPRLFAPDSILTAKVVYFRSHVSHTLYSLLAHTATGKRCEPFNVSLPPEDRICTGFTQDGKEHREGLEVELGYQTEHWFSSLNLSGIRGKQICEGEHPLFDVPGDTLVFTIGRSDLGHRLEYGYRLRAVDQRRVITGSTGSIVSPCNVGLIIGNQAGYVLHNLFASYQPFHWLSVNVAADNITNTRYFLNNGFGGGIGQEAPGYNIRFFVTLSY